MIDNVGTVTAAAILVESRATRRAERTIAFASRALAELDEEAWMTEATARRLS